MARLPRHSEHHVIERLGWLRAAVLGANDGILSTSSLILGVASAQGTHQSVLIAGISGLVAGAMSMAAGEYVSVSSQSDSERADLGRERKELSEDRDGELRELAGIRAMRLVHMPGTNWEYRKRPRHGRSRRPWRPQQPSRWVELSRC
jgi:VIT1/CCC1 family predicted Fe2+/Mn2+ transporter